MSRSVNTTSGSSVTAAAASADDDERTASASEAAQDAVTAAIAKLTGKSAGSPPSSAPVRCSASAASQDASSSTAPPAADTALASATSTPPVEPKSAPAAESAGAEGASVSATPDFEVDPELETLSTLSRHMDKVPNGLKFDQLDALSQDESLPADLRQAYADLRDNPDLLKRLDNMVLDSRRDWRKHGDDQLIGHNDLRKAFNDPELQAYNQKKAEVYAQNYIPSDAQSGDTQPRPITESDAARELYLYSASLPSTVDHKALEQIVSGQCPGKCPPQLIAAAQYMLDNPESFDKMAPDGNVSQGELENNVAPLLNLREEELSALDVMKRHPDAFFKDGVATRESLLELANDESASEEIRMAAATLHDSPVAFGMLDNASKGHAAKGANDGKIGPEDLDSLQLSKTNRTPPKVPASREEAPNASPTDTLAANAMLAGMVDDPEAKKERGGGSRLGRILGRLSKALDVVKTAVDAVAGFLPPPANGIAAGISTAIGAANNFGLKAGMAMANGVPRKDAMKQAAKDFAFDAAASAASAIPAGGAAVKGAVMGAKQAAMAVAKEGVEAGVREGVEAGVKRGVKEGVETGLKESAESRARSAAGDLASGAREGAESRAKSVAGESAEAAGTRGAGKAGKAGKEGAEEAAEEGVMATVKGEIKEEVKATVQDEISYHVQTAISEKTGYSFGGSGAAEDGGMERSCGGGRGKKGRGGVDRDRGDEGRDKKPAAGDRAERGSSADNTDAKADKDGAKADKSADKSADKNADKNADKEAAKAEREAQREEAQAARQERDAAASVDVTSLMALQSLMLKAGERRPGPQTSQTIEARKPAPLGGSDAAA